MKQNSDNSKATNPLGDSRNVKKRISSNDYAAWEKFDVVRNSRINLLSLLLYFQCMDMYQIF